MTLLATVFNYETPVYLILNDEHEELIELMRKIYKKNEVKQRLETLRADVDKESNDDSITYHNNETTYMDVFTSKAAWVGITLAILQ